MIDAGEQQWQLAPTRGFLRLALACLFARRTALPLTLLMLILVGTGIVALLFPPMPDAPAPLPFVAATIARAIATCWLAAAILRRAVASERPAWLPDGAFWLFLLPFSATLAIPLLMAPLLGGLGWLPGHLIGDAVAVLFVGLLGPWLVALVAAGKAGLSPWLRGAAQWLPHRIGWGLLLLVPLGFLHLWLGSLPFVDARWFWVGAIGEGLVWFLLLALRLGLDAAAYWRVAQG